MLKFLKKKIIAVFEIQYNSVDINDDDMILISLFWVAGSMIMPKGRLRLYFRGL